jgi:molybdopterin-binding protein
MKIVGIQGSLSRPQPFCDSRRSIQGEIMSITAINVRNQFRGKVREVIEGRVVSEVDVETPSGLIVTSVITTRSIKELGLVVGKEVIALVKATEVSIASL